MSSASSEPRARALSLRAAIGMACVGLAYVAALSHARDLWLDRVADDCLSRVRESHKAVLGLFQGSYYFYYSEQFLPGLRARMAEVPLLSRVQVVSPPSTTLFDSDDPRDPGRQETYPAYSGPEGPALAPLVSGFSVRIVAPAAQGSPMAVVYTFAAAEVRARVLGWLAAGLAALGLAGWILSRAPAAARLSGAWKSFWGLRTQFLLTIAVVNGVTGGIVFFTLSALQTREQTSRIRSESLLFARFATSQVISDFSSYFYFYYADKFLPSIRSLVATNENLVGIRVLSRRTGAVLFDSMRLSAPDGGAGDGAGSEAPAQPFPPEVESELKARDVAVRDLERGGEPLLSVVQTYRSENQEALFLVEYLFGFQSLSRSLAAIRSQILIDLVPSMAFGLVIAAIFAQLLIGPIRRLAQALRQVSAGNYGATVEVDRGDELGELMAAFNQMTVELGKKKELRKYLSDSTYRRVMEEGSPGAAPSAPGGRRVPAAVLFSDIRDFVGHCECLEAEEVTAMLNGYFSEMVDVVRRHGGEVDKFIGDAFLAVFYVGEDPQSSPAATSMRAIDCALEMRERLKDLNRRRAETQSRLIETGVGITYGELISGPIGAKDRMDFTVIGDVVNLAARIEKLSKDGRHTRIVFSHHVEELVRGLVASEPLSHEPIRGKKEESVAVHELIGVRDLSSLLADLSAPDPKLRARAAELLGRTRNPEALPHAVAALSDAEEQVRLAAAGAVGRLARDDDAGTFAAIGARLGLEPSERVVGALITAAGRLGGGGRIMAIAPFLASANERIVANAVAAIGQSRWPEAADLLLPQLNSRNNRVKANAAMALFSAGHHEIIGTLKPMLMNSDPLMRSSAAFALGELTTLTHPDRVAERLGKPLTKAHLGELQECVPMLVSLLRDPDARVRRQAVVALGKIKDKSAILPIIDAVNLEEDSKELLRDVAQALRSIGSHKLVREVIEKMT